MVHLFPCRSLKRQRSTQAAPVTSAYLDFASELITKLETHPANPGDWNQESGVSWHLHQQPRPSQRNKPPPNSTDTDEQNASFNLRWKHLAELLGLEVPQH